MMITRDVFPRCSPVGDSALLLELGASLSQEINDRVLSLDAWLSHTPLVGIKSWVPGYASLLVLYDPLRIKLSEVEAWLMGCLESCPEAGCHSPKQIEISVRYGGEDGPDLAYVADFHGVTPADVVRLHTSRTYRVGMMGFTPGFAYLLGLDPDLRRRAWQRLARTCTLALWGLPAARQVFILWTHRRWQIIGRTDCTLFDPQHDHIFSLPRG